MAWNNPDLIVFHGSSTTALGAYGPVAGQPLRTFRVNLSKGNVSVDFGQGFYVTTKESQAHDWANQGASKARTGPSPVDPNSRAVLLKFEIDRDVLAGLDTLCFMRPDADYFTFTDDCRTNARLSHGRPGPKFVYDVVYGPVRIWKQRQVMGDCDQISFHTRSAVTKLPRAHVEDIGDAATGELFVP